MTKLYRLKDRLVRELEDGDAVRLRCLKRAGFVVGELPPLPKAKQPKAEKPIAPTEGEELDSAKERKPVLATHAPIVTADLVSMDADGFAVSVEDLAFPDVTVTVNGVEFEGVMSETATLSEMGIKKLRAVAKENEITIPFEVRTKKDIATYLAEKLEGADNG